MPRLPRVAPGGFAYHVLNRANGRLRLFRKDEDFEAFYRSLQHAMQRHPIRILGWCLMANHWHFIVWPQKDGELSRFFGYLTLLHSTRWQAAHGASGMGHVYQSRFRSFMIQPDSHLLATLRYVERNPLRARLVKHAQDWRYSSLHARLNGPAELKNLQSAWPIDRPTNWTQLVNRAQPPEEEAAIAQAIRRSRPFGDPRWVKRIVDRYDLHSTLRPQGRPVGWRKKRR